MDIEQKSNLFEEMYHFNQSIQQWILCPHISLASDNLNNPSLDDMCLPKRCQFLTWNIFYDDNQLEFLYTYQRYQEILKTLKSFLPDIICLQEVTKSFLNLLLNEIWLKENNYYIIIMKNIHDNNQKQQSYGQIMLMKNIRPRAFSISSLDISENSIDTEKNEYIIARFGLNSKVTIDLINLHLYKNSNEKRCQSLEYFFKTMNTQNYILIGDFNFGDYDINEQSILEKYQYQIHDLWKDIYDLDENPGYTFNPTHNDCAQITSDSQVNLRSDRYLFHKLQNLSYSIEHLNLVDLETIPIDLIKNKYINQSKHYALQLILNFRIRSISHNSALVILSPMDIWSFNEQYNSLLNQCLPHINLFCPFFDLIDTEDDVENILLPLRLLLTQYQSFNIEINEINSTIENNIISMKLNQQSIIYIKELHKQIKQLFSQCLFDNKNNYNPHTIISKINKSIQFPVRYIYILQQLCNNESTQYRIAYQLPLGSVLEPIGLNQFDYINFDLKEFFNKMNLYENEKSYEQKCEKFNQLSICFKNFFNKNPLNYFSYIFLPYGSFRLGLHGEDLDTVFVLSEKKSTDNKTELDKIFHQFKYNPIELNNHIIDLLDKQIQNDFKNEIIDCRKIQALYPIISILFYDQTKVEIFVQIKDKSILDEQYQDEAHLLSNFYEPIHGVHDVERLIAYVRFPSIFQYLLTFIRTWAQNIGIYGQVYGYLGGYSWAILCAYICHIHISSINSPFSLEEFFLLVKKFFSIYSQFNWSYESVQLDFKNSYFNQISTYNHGSMRILCPAPPFNNTSRSTINSTCYLIIQNFQNIHQMIDKTIINYENVLNDILHISNQFPDKTIQSILQLTLSSKTINEFNQWIGYMKSRLGHFLIDCQDECNLFIQTDNKVHKGKHILEKYYFIAFQLNENQLSRHRKFYYCLNKFFDEFKYCLFRNENMKISYKLMSIHDWNIEHMQI